MIPVLAILVEHRLLTDRLTEDHSIYRASIALRGKDLFEKYICILALKMASPENQHCANCIGTLSLPISIR